jgi:hypothetical protein
MTSTPNGFKITAGQFETFRRRELAKADVHPLRRARLAHDERGMTLSALAGLSGVSVRTLERIELRERRVSRRTYRRIAAALGLPLSAIGG